MKAATLLLTFLMLTGLPNLSHANLIMLDFGGTTVSGDSLLESPYHSLHGSFTDNVWNKQGQGNDSTLLWSDGTSATGISYVTLKNASGGQTALATAGWSASVSGSSINTGVYGETSVGADGYMMTTTLNATRAIGIQVAGLPFGEYELYVSGRNTNYDASEYSINFYAAAGSSAGAFDIASGFNSESVTFAAGTTDKTSAWTFDSNDPSASNFVILSVNLTALNPYLNIATMGNAGADVSNGYFNSIQIAAIPEPSSLILSCLGLAGLLYGAIRNSTRR